ncbi:MAG TPA: hypothetical protein VFP61_10675 [Acidimicrobiales bacterium]|nr:hypothetical protein [Acidimicrobiales bacterium]
MASLDTVARRLAGTCDAVLVGDHGGVRNDFPPSFMAAALLDRGVAPWVTLACRDRNRVALAAELAALAALGVPGVHCVTGDWQGSGGPVGEARVFDLDALRLVGAARAAGLAVSVAASPAAPPAGLRARRLAAKVAAGASAVFVNHCGGPGPVARFVAAARGEGADATFVACVPVTADARALADLARLPGVALDPVAAEEAAAPAGADLAAVAAVRMLEVEGVDGVNLSGWAAADVATSATVMAGVGTRLLAHRSSR